MSSCWAHRWGGGAGPTCCRRRGNAFCGPGDEGESSPDVGALAVRGPVAEAAFGGPTRAPAGRRAERAGGVHRRWPWLDPCQHLGDSPLVHPTRRRQLDGRGLRQPRPDEPLCGLPAARGRHGGPHAARGFPDQRGGARQHIARRAVHRWLDRFQRPGLLRGRRPTRLSLRGGRRNGNGHGSLPAHDYGGRRLPGLCLGGARGESGESALSHPAHRRGIPGAGAGSSRGQRLGMAGHVPLPGRPKRGHRVRDHQQRGGTRHGGVRRGGGRRYPLRQRPRGRRARPG